MTLADQSQERKGYLYRHIRLDTKEIFYIGIGIDNNFVRSRKKWGRSNFWKSIVAKTKYKIEIILQNIPYPLLLEKEKYFIKLYGRRDLGTGTLVNLTDGGEGSLGSKHSEESKLKISESRKGKKMSEESIRKRSITNSKKVIQKNLDETVVKIWNSAAEAGRNGFNKCNIGACCKGKLKTHKGFLWSLL